MVELLNYYHAIILIPFFLTIKKSSIFLIVRKFFVGMCGNLCSSLPLLSYCNTYSFICVESASYVGRGPPARCSAVSRDPQITDT